jgi:hypothetical protein
MVRSYTREEGQGLKSMSSELRAHVRTPAQCHLMTRLEQTLQRVPQLMQRKLFLDELRHAKCTHLLFQVGCSEKGNNGGKLKTKKSMREH